MGQRAGGMDYSAVAVSVLSFGLLAYACARVILRLTNSPLAALAGTIILVLNPDLLYLQATPMTEPLLLASKVPASMLTGLTPIVKSDAPE